MKNRTHLGHLGHLGVLFPKRKNQINSRINNQHPEGKKHQTEHPPTLVCLQSWELVHFPSPSRMTSEGKKPIQMRGFLHGFLQTWFHVFWHARCEPSLSRSKIRHWNVKCLISWDGRLLVTIPVKNRKKKVTTYQQPTKPTVVSPTNHGLPDTSEPRRKPRDPRRFPKILGHRKK